MAIATVINVKGEVFAVNKDGVKRRLQKGDQLQEGEILVTAPGSSAELDMGGGKTVQVAEQQTFAVDGSVGGPAQPSAATSAIESAAAAQKVIQALAAGDANALLEAEAAAAGLAGGGAADGGSSFVQLLRISEGVTGVGYEYGNFSQGRVDQPTPGAIEEITQEVQEPEEPEQPEEPTRALVSIEGPGEVTEGDVTTDYTLSVDQETTADLIVTLTYTGVALDGTDFTGVVQVTIPSGSSSVTFNIATLDDNLAEDSELYTVTITGVSGGGFDVVQINPAADSVDTAIVDEVEDVTPQEALVSIVGPGSVVEGSTTTNYTVSVDQPTTAALVVTLSYTGVAVDGTDFTGVTEVTIPANSSSVTFDISTLDDNLVEGGELYTVTITGVSGGGFELVQVDPDADHVNTLIVDNDNNPPTVLNGFIITNTSNVPRTMLLTFQDANDPSKFFQKELDVPTGGQKDVAIVLNEDVGFAIDPNAQYTVTLTYVSGGKIIVTNMVLEGVDLVDTNDNAHLGDNTQSTVYGVTATFTPSGATSVDPTLIDYSIAGDHKDETLSGTPGADVMAGENGNDNMSGGAGNDVLVGGEGNDTLIGGVGSDVLLGGSGNDVFKWSPNDQGTGATPAVDIIADFGNGTDKIDLRDLLQGEHDGSGSILSNLSSYLVGFDYVEATNSTIVNVSTHGDGVVDQQIVLAAVDITDEGELSPAMIIANLLSQQKLVVDS